ncbi:helix-turn-helix transcriptional regulator [Streptomyces sp. HNM0574]|uniref:helix-turn-helix domain-containing protein n=1 Tax=Streptomyces sp. HNM0574 TaxID=2714954 RepID=UPI00146CD585|nr:helix-turn-helix transcriptional regulator [Streptomyces sp. HNM0574]NLU66774.1 helix-turn-helix domain-containing protein [Streptomyces sp. HNM0574]
MRFQSQSLTPDRSTRHFFGSELRRRREEAGLSLLQLAKIVNSSKSTLARVETAELMPPPDLPPKLDLALGLDGFFGRLHALVKREAHPDQYRRFMDFEAKATVIEVYEPQVVPGLLQTEDYARAFLSCQEHLTAEEVEELVAARLSRQEPRTSGGNPLRWAILDESVLWRRVVGPEQTYNQLAVLLEQVDTPDSKVQVMPFRSGLHALMGGALNLLTLPKGVSVAYEEGIQVSHLYEDAADVRGWRRQYDVLRANALSLSESAELIREAMEDCTSCETPET